MTDHPAVPIRTDPYQGKFLRGHYSSELKNRVSECIAAFEALENLGTPVMPYISAWKEKEKILWYEYAGRQFMQLLDCPHTDIARTFRESIIDRRVYKYPDPEKEIQEEIISRHELSGFQTDLREEGKKTGFVEAIYKIGLKNRPVIWLKDRANVETFKKDRACLSPGCLIDVTKEMEQKELLEQIGYSDDLTKLPNRNILDRVFELNISRVDRKHLVDFAFLMIDIDHFKSVNDTYGHLGGDHVLSAVAEVMKTIKRKEDEIGRYGGEEFYALCPGNIRSGYQFADRLRKKIEKTPFIYNGQPIHITVSIGVASALETDRLSAEQLIALADKRLYIAKREGRNRVIGLPREKNHRNQ